MASLPRAARATHPVALARSGVVVAGVVVALVVWAVASVAVDDLRQPGFGTAPSQHLGAGVVAATSLIGGLLGWAALTVVERFTARGRTLWLAIVSAALLLSLGGPLSGGGVSHGNRAALALLHLAVALVVIPLLFRTSSSSPSTRLEDR